MRCYLLNNQKNIINIDIERLKTKFSIEDTKLVQKEINNLIFKGFINAKWNDKQIEFFNVLGEYGNTDLQNHLQALENNIRVLAENNILLLEAAMKTG